VHTVRDVVSVYFIVDGYLPLADSRHNMSESERDERGRFVQKHTDSDVLAAVGKHEPAATSEVAAELGIERPSADYRLRRLEDTGRVTSKKIGNSLAWRLVDGE
jgi:predicted transcriptional regulator